MRRIPLQEPGGADTARGAPADWNRMAFWSIGLLMGTAGLVLAAFLYLAWR